MTELEHLIEAACDDATIWPIVADYLEENGRLESAAIRLYVPELEFDFDVGVVGDGSVVGDGFGSGGGFGSGVGGGVGGDGFGGGGDGGDVDGGGFGDGDVDGGSYVRTTN